MARAATGTAAGAGGVLAAGSGFVKLISAEGHVFHVERRCAVVSGTIRTMLSGEFKESGGEIRFPEISTAVLERVIQYFHHKVKFSNSTAPPPDFRIEPELALDLLMASNYLECVAGLLTCRLLYAKLAKSDHTVCVRMCRLSSC